MDAVAEKKEISAIDGKFLTFVLGSEIYGIEILNAREIIGLIDITTVPQPLDYMKGVINLRGKVIPVIDLRMKFSMQEEKHTQETCVIVVEVNNTSIGIIVDSVSEVLEIKSGEIEVSDINQSASLIVALIEGMALQWAIEPKALKRDEVRRSIGETIADHLGVARAK